MLAYNSRVFPHRSLEIATASWHRQTGGHNFVIAARKFVIPHAAGIQLKMAASKRWGS
jgi:hypothetical protein